MDAAFLQALVSEQVTGMLLSKRGDTATLVVGEHPPFGNGHSAPLATGMFTIRYAIPLYTEPHIAIIPSMLVAERGGELVGWRAWDFIFKRYELHPRAEIFGLRSDGVADQLFLRTLDIAAPLRIYAYRDWQASTPLAHVTQVIASPDTPLPERLAQ